MKKKEKEIVSRRDKDTFLTIGSWIGSVFIILFCIVAIGRAVFLANYKYYPVNGISMQPTINATSSGIQDGVYIKYNSEIEDGDIIIIQLDGFSRTIIKRAIAQEGDKVCIRKRQNDEYRISVIRKGSTAENVLDEDYILSYEGWSEDPGIDADGHCYESRFYTTFIEGQPEQVSLINGSYYYEVPENNIFYLGDNRVYSADCRNNGTCDRSCVVGVVKIFVRDIDVAKAENRLIWAKLGAIFNYFWQEIVNFFAWNV